MGQKTSLHQRGLTLIECLVTVAILGIMLGMALPAFGLWMQQARGTAYVNEFLASVLLTRSEAIKQRHRVTMCTSADGAFCDSSSAWSQGWIVFHDANANGLRDANETLVRSQPALTRGWVATGNSTVQHRISYVATGHSRQIPQSNGGGGGFQAGTITFCPPPGHRADATRVVINSMGRVRTDQAPSANCTVG